MLYSLFDVGFCDKVKVLFEIGIQSFCKLFFVVYVEIRIQETLVLQCIHVAVKQFRIVRHNRTVVVIFALSFVEIVGKTRVENGIYAVVYELFHVTVHDFCGIAGSV